MTEFLRKHGWSVVRAVGEDGSARRYMRVRKGEQTAILMENYGDTPGHRVEDFIRIAQWLNQIGLNAPDIYEAEDNFLLLEDFGDVSFKKALDRGADARQLYALAADIIQYLNAQSCPLSLPEYYRSHVHAGHRRVIDWFVPAMKKQANPDGLVQEYLDIWQEIEQGLAPCPKAFLHIDFHVQNLMWLPHEHGKKRCGILDFQGAMIGPAPYDLGNLLEDARIDVPYDLRQELLTNHDELYQRWYRVVTTQFHCRVIGQFIKLAVKENKPIYLQHLPRLGRYLAAGLEDPVLHRLKTFFSDLTLDFNDIKGLNADEIRAYISPDAY